MNCKRLNIQNIQDTTKQFYSHFCGIDILKLKQGIYFICSSECDVELKGFGRKDTDYSLYESFFRATKPTANPDGWLYEYFIEKTTKEYFVGYIKNGKLVSVCDAPDMPYMEDKIQHTGIEALEVERKKGCAKCFTSLTTHNLIENGSCPQ